MNLVMCSFKDTKIISQITMLSKQLMCLLNFSDIFGYNSGSSKLSSNKAVARFINFIQIGFTVVFIYIQFSLTVKLFLQLRLIELLNQILQFTAAIYTYLFIVLDSMRLREKHQGLWKTIRIIDKYFACQTNNKYFCYFLKCAFYFCTSMFCLTLNFMLIDMPIPLTVFVYYSLVKICQVRVFYYIFCIEVLECQLKTVNNELKTQTINQAYQFNWIRGYYHHIHEMTYFLNEVFGWSHVAAVSFCFYFFLTDLNWFHGNIYILTTTQCLSMFGFRFSTSFKRK